MADNLSAADSSDIEYLISQRQGRPQFARTISWEFGNATLNSTSGKKLKLKPKRKVSGPSDDIQSGCSGDTGHRDRLSTIGSSHDPSSSDSEYYTAVEDELELENISDSRCTSVSTDDPFTGTCIEIPDIADDSSNDEACLEQQGSTDTGVLQTGRRRWRSKRQRKRHMQEYVTFADNLLVLGDLYNLNTDIDKACEEAGQTTQQRNIERKVPSLAELCMAASRKMGQSEKQLILQLPSLVKRDVSNWRQEQAFLRKQLKWLQNHLLPFIDNPDDFKALLFYSKKDAKDSGHSVLKFILPTRNVWNYLPRYIELFWDFDAKKYISGNAASFLLHVDLQESSLDTQPNNAYKSYYSGFAMRTVTSLSALATAIDLMLPAMVSDRNLGQQNVKEEELLKNAQNNMIAGVRFTLKSRFPRVVDELFDRAIPYVMWARGNVGLATELFRTVIQTEKRSRHKAMFLSVIARMNMMFGDHATVVGRHKAMFLSEIGGMNMMAMFLSEIARMNVMFGDHATAVTFYKLASDAAVKKPSFEDDDLPELWIQLHILRAHMHDTGLLTPEKALESSCCWLSAINVSHPHMPRRLTATVVGALQAFLCYHAYHWKEPYNVGTQKNRLGERWVEEALSRIRLWGKDQPYLHYLASMLLALDGKDKESKAAFDKCRESDQFRHAGGLGASFLQLPRAICKKFKNPWQPLVSMATSQKDSIMPLEVIWRTQLVTPSLCNDRRRIEAHIVSMPLDLRLDTEGNVTGDMQMVLPPLRSVGLDPYTGSVVINRVPSATTIWKQSYFPPTEFLVDELYIPTRHLIYSNPNGTTVHLEKMGTVACQQNRDDLSEISMVLYWNSGNQVAKIDAVHAVKKYYAQKTKQDVIDSTMQQLTPELRQEMIELIPVCLSRNCDISCASLRRMCDKRWSGEKKDKKDKARNVKVPKREKYWYLFKHPLNIRQAGNPVVFGDSILVQFWKNDGSNIFNMFLRTESQAAFLDVNIQNDMMNCKSGIYSPRFPHQYQLDQTDRQFVMMTSKDSDRDVAFYDGHGECFCELSEIAGAVKLAEEGCPCVIGNYLYTVTPRSESEYVVRKTSIGRDVVHQQYDSEAFTPYWDLQTNTPTIYNLKVVGQSVCVEKNSGKLLVVHTTLGLSFIDPATLDLVPVDVHTDSELVYPLNEDRNILRGTFEAFNILSEQYYSDPAEAPISRFAVAIEFYLLVFDIQYHLAGHATSQCLQLVAIFALPGIPQEVCFIGKQGVLVTCCHDNSDHHHLFLFTLDGHLCGVLLCLGPGPRSFLPVYRHGNTERGQGQSGWVVYMRDGHGGILCVGLQQA